MLVLHLALTLLTTPAQLVSRIQDADYRGDRAALAKLVEQSEPLVKSDPARIEYWRGFAMWRRGVNGYYDPKATKELEADFTSAIDEFEKSLSADPSYVDSKIGEAACVMTLAYLDQKNADRIKILVPKFVRLFAECEKAAPENPRLCWVRGPELWYLPESRGGGQGAAFAQYEKGLKLWANQPRPANPLDPTWGQPELLMNMSWSYLNQTTPDPGRAETYAKKALALVPHWHYVKDILMLQIEAAKKK